MPTLRSIIPILPVASIDRALAFYRSLGFTASSYAGGGDYAFLLRDDLEIHLRCAPDLLADHNPTGIYLLLGPGTAAMLEAEFRAAGVNILSPLAVRPWEMLEFVLSDPDGNLLRFGEPASAHPPGSVSTDGTERNS